MGLFNGVLRFFKKKEDEMSIENFKKLNSKDRNTKMYQELLVIRGNK